MRPYRLFAVLSVLAVSACASPSDRISSALIEQGIDRGYAVCLGDRLAARLSNEQLRQLADAADAYGDGKTLDRLTIDDLIDVADAIDDPMVVVAVTRAGIGCGITRWRDASPRGGRAHPSDLRGVRLGQS